MGLAKPLTKAAQKETSVTVISPEQTTGLIQVRASLALGDAVARWYTSLRTGDLSPRTIQAYTHSVDRLTGF